MTLKPGEPCDHPGCLAHQTHPCEGCGRIGGQGTVLSMGCKVEGLEFLEPPNVFDGPIPEWVTSRNPQVKFDSLALVDSPKCEECSSRMVGSGGGTRWVCVIPTCPQQGKPVDVPGIYPAHTVVN